MLHTEVPDIAVSLLPVISGRSGAVAVAEAVAVRCGEAVFHRAELIRALTAYHFQNPRILQMQGCTVEEVADRRYALALQYLESYRLQTVAHIQGGAPEQAA